jgi:putative chitinase
MRPLHYKIANDDRGVTEIRGRMDNGRIVEMFAEAGHPYVDDDETPWCAAAMGSWLKRAGLPQTGDLTARSYQKYGREVEGGIENAEVGDIVVFWRDHPNSWKGHVGLYEDQTANRVKVLGGNQRDKVGSNWYVKDRIVAVRRPVYAAPADPTKRRKLDSAFLRELFPNARQDLIDELPDVLAEVFNEYEINTPERVAMFLANVSAETGGLTIMEESLSYSAARLMEVWPSRFRTMAKARAYARNPEKLGNYVYNRFGNKGIPGAGYKYRGRGLLQTTFIDGYRRIEEVTGLPVVDNPDLLLDPRNAAIAAGIYWADRRVNEYADRGDVEGARKRVNGGLIGITKTRSEYQRLLPLVRNMYVEPPKPGEVAIIGTGIGAAITAFLMNPSTLSFFAGAAVVALAGGLVYYLRKRKKKANG